MSRERLYRKTPDDVTVNRYEVLQKSEFDQEMIRWIHECGQLIKQAKVTRLMVSAAEAEASGMPFHHRRDKFPFLGYYNEQRPYCNDCEEKPRGYDERVLVEDVELKDEKVI